MPSTGLARPGSAGQLRAPGFNRRTKKAFTDGYSDNASSASETSMPTARANAPSTVFRMGRGECQWRPWLASRCWPRGDQAG